MSTFYPDVDVRAPRVQWDYVVTALYRAEHPYANSVAVETRHKGSASMQAEVEASKMRHDIGLVKVRTLKTGRTEVVWSVFPTFPAVS